MIYIGLFFLSLVLTYTIKSYAIRKAVLDIPNERSSHIKPTPRGGGVAIVMVIYIGILYFKESVDSKLFYALFCSLPIAFISLMDDIFSISSKIRLMIQSVSAILALYFLGGVSSIDFIFFEIHGWWINVISFFAIVWLTNLYNFLDGIDGYAASEAVMVGLGIALFFYNPLGLVIVAACLGFLLFNWHQASIFMGDVGSATLGFIFAVFVFYDTSQGSIYIWLILLSIFWFDATLTLIQRYRNDEVIAQAHRKHAYQRLVQSGWSHNRVVWFALGFNLIFIVLLYFIEDVRIVFLFNIISLIIIAKLINNKKSFI